MTTITKLTPMLQQYLEIKNQHEDTILFYRMGDFYEMFFDDAIIASKILGITLTSRNKKSDANQVPMCGIPYHAAQNYLGKLIKAGKRVAICEQTEDPAQAKGIVKREVIRVVSPGVVTDDMLLDDKSNNFVSSLTCSEKAGKRLYGMSFLDVSTGTFFLGELLTEKDSIDDILDQLTRLTPSELLISEKETEQLNFLLENVQNILPDLCITTRPSTLYHQPAAEELLHEHFGVVTLDGFGCSSFSNGIIAAAALLEYIQETQKTAIDHIETLLPLNTESILLIDESSRRNLELTQTLAGAERHGSLLSILDQTCTPMGARQLKHNLLFPLQEKHRITDRLDAVTFFFNNSSLRKELREALESVYDLERLNSRMILGSGNGRDMLAMKRSLANLPAIHLLLAGCDTQKLIDIRDDLDLLTDILHLLDKTINHEAPVTLRDGNLIKSGYNEELDELVTILQNGKQLILDLEAKERQSTGIAKLKIGFNKVFGYFIEVSRLHADKVPEHYIRKQTLVNAERFITPELKEFETKVLGAQDRRVELEYQLFIDIRLQLAKSSSRILKTASYLAQIDYLQNNAEIAHAYNYRRPEIDNDDEIIITEGRHPVIERALPAGKFVPNDVCLDQTKNEVLIITGPNMAGKSTVLRQTALIVLMAQMGCYVPVESAKIGIVDRIFTRVGAMDNLRRGQSTFMVEMSETANILNNATPRSLVILDEIGRGTSTYDGLSIAWAVTEDLVKKKGKGVKTLFATHYHELLQLAREHKRIQNFSIAVREWRGSIIFLHKLIEGGTNKSYGIQVAGLAGVPPHVVARAEEVLKNIEQAHQLKKNSIHDVKKNSIKRSHPDQLSLFKRPDPLRDFLNSFEINECTPLEALNTLHDLKKLL